MTGREGVARTVDVHTHAIPRSLVDRAASGAFSGVDMSGGEDAVDFQFPDMDAAPPAPPSLMDFARLHDWFASKGVEVALIGPWTDLLGYTLGETVACEWTRCYNESLVEACSAHPGMVPLSTIPLSYPTAALGELVAAHDMGCKGVMIGTDIPGLHLGSYELDPVWELAAELGMPIVVHPTFLRVPQELRGSGLKNAVGRAGPMALALARLVYSGALVRHPNLVIIASHGGGAFAAAAPRIVRNHAVGWSESNYDPVDSIRRLFFDSVVLDPTYLEFLVRVYGSDRILLGSDHPFPWEPDPLMVISDADLTHTERTQIASGNARRLFGSDLW